MPNISFKAAALVSVLSLCACDNQRIEPPVQEAESQVARALLFQANGSAAGEAIVAQGDGELLLTVNVENMEAGTRGVHIHGKGMCDAPDFKGAGGHWNPTNAEHGLENPAGAHAGDLPNLVIGEDGTGTLEARIKAGVLQDGALQDGDVTLMDADGASFMVHAGPDDMVTDPSGDSGSRIACGVFAISTGGVN